MTDATEALKTLLAAGIKYREAEYAFQTAKTTKQRQMYLAREAARNELHAAEDAARKVLDDAGIPSPKPPAQGVGYETIRTLDGTLLYTITLADGCNVHFVSWEMMNDYMRQHNLVIEF